MIKNRIKYGIYILAVSLTSVACSSDSAGNEEGTEETPAAVNLITFDSPAAQDEVAGMIVNNCYACHSPNATKETRLAPPMSHVKSHYLDEYETKAEFVAAMQHFILAPTSEDVIMYGAESKFGVMPNMQYPEEMVNKIVNYLYDYEIETAEWLAKYHEKKTAEVVFEAGDYLGKGRHIATNSKQELGKHLKGKINQEGTEAAVRFCQVNAIPIVDSMATLYNAEIYRVSDRNRNPKNQANGLEKEYIQNYQKQIDAKEDMPPILVEDDLLATFYMPIVTNDMCLQCHGIKKDIAPNVLSAINNLYPADKATGYGINEIRGIWKIVMEK